MCVAEDLNKENFAERQIPEMTIGRAALVILMRRYLSALMDPTITLLELQKLMYFMQETGEPLKLHFKKALYGPYAENLRHVLNYIEGHFVSGYLDGGDDPTKPLELKPNAVQEAELYLKNHPATNERLERVTQLIQGFETPYGMELLSTVYWIAKDKNVLDAEQVVNEFHNLNERKRMFSSEHIMVALETLLTKHWIKSLSIKFRLI
jgi:O-acetyl-ADP-ribose deacetylase (regulator of RNase III)